MQNTAKSAQHCAKESASCCTSKSKKMLIIGIVCVAANRRRGLAGSS